MDPSIQSPLEAPNSNASATVDPWRAFYDSGCRPYFRYYSCGSTYQDSLRIYFWVVFSLHLLSTFAAFAYAVYAFFPCFKRDSSTQRLNLRIYLCLSLASVSSMATWSYFGTDPYQYGAPPYLTIILFSISINSLFMSVMLTLLTWAETLNNKDMKISRGAWLDKYQRIFWVVLIERLIVDLPLGPLAAANINETYFLFFRLWLGHWVLSFLISIIPMFYYGRKMEQKLRSIGLEAAANRIKRIYILFCFAGISTANFAALQLGVMQLSETSPLGWYLINPFYHIGVILCTAWFIIGRPTENELKKRGATSNSQNQANKSLSTA